MMVSNSDQGAELYGLIEELYPICRSITGDGVRQSLEILRRYVPLDVHEVVSGTQVFDWTIPDEWNIRDAWIKDASGNRVVDFRQSNLHVVSYSEPVRQRIHTDELQSHLHSLPNYPDWIPYRTSYYSRTWGFCLTENQRRALTESEYDVCIDSQLAPGHLTYGEFYLPGENPQEYVFSTHVCHPSLCNDNLSGVAISVFLARHLAQKRHRWSYRFLFIPGTIGAVTWLACNQNTLQRIRGGLTLVCLGDSAPLTYKQSFSGDADIDQAAALALRDLGKPYNITEFDPYGYDERQFNAPGFRIPVGSLMRSRHGQFPEYHTSADNLSFISRRQLASSLECLTHIIHILETNRRYLNQVPYGEPQLGKRGIYREMDRGNQDLQHALLWLLSFSDGEHSLVDVAERSQMPYSLMRRAADILHEKGVLE